MVKCNRLPIFNSFSFFFFFVQVHIHTYMLATNSFEAEIELPCLDNKNLTVNVNKGQNVKDFVHHLVQTHALPPHVFASIYSTLTCAMTLQNTDSIPQPTDKKELRHLFLDAYQSNTLQYNNKPEEVKKKKRSFPHFPLNNNLTSLLF